MARRIRHTLASFVLSGSILRIELDSGHHLDLRVTGTGDDWFSGDNVSSEDKNSAVIVLFRSIRTMRSDEDESLGWNNPAKITPGLAKPLGALVANLAILRKKVSVYGLHNRWNGQVIAGFADYAILRPFGAEDVAVPYSAISWIAVY